MPEANVSLFQETAVAALQVVLLLHPAACCVAFQINEAWACESTPKDRLATRAATMVCSLAWAEVQLLRQHPLAAAAVVATRSFRTPTGLAAAKAWLDQAAADCLAELAVAAASLAANLVVANSAAVSLAAVSLVAANLVAANSVAVVGLVKASSAAELEQSLVADVAWAVVGLAEDWAAITFQIL